jgi:diguanylate cyclase (GGDEF)-like protein/PAS domain S-box-containing protein
MNQIVREADFFADAGTSSSAAELTEASLVDTQARLGSMVEMLPIGLMIHTAQAVVYSNRAATLLLGTPMGALRGRHFLDFVRAAEYGATERLFHASLGGDGAPVDSETVLCCLDGTEKVMRLTLARLPWPGNPVVQILMQDVTAQKQAETSLRQQAIVDELTGAYNRRHLFYEGALFLDEYTASGRPVSVVLMDVDHFKSINDRFGHAVGDDALRAIVATGHAVLPTIAGTDAAMLARFGGEEFAVLLPGLDGAAAAYAAEQLRLEIARLELDADGIPFSFTASMGVATFRPEDGTLDGLLRRADVALYRAKSKGRNRVCTAL